MPFDKRRESRVIAVIEADVVCDGRGEEESSLRVALERVNRLYFSALAEPFTLAEADRIDGALSDPSRAPLCISVLRESLAPRLLRVGVGLGPAAAGPDADGEARDAFSGARRALRLTIRDDGLTRYVGAGEGGDVLLAALCRLVDPLIRARTSKQWEAIAAYRELGHQRDVAEKLGVTRQSVGDRLVAGHRRDVDEADAAVSTYLSYIRRQRLSH
jgi:hypothetical protein